MTFVKVGKSKSGAWTVQLAMKEHGHMRILKHFGSAHTEAELKRLKSLATQAKHQPASGQVNLFVEKLDLDRVQVIEYRPYYFERLIRHYYQKLGFNELSEGLLFDLVLTRIYQPCSKLKSLRILQVQFGRSYSFQTAYRLLSSLAEDKHKSKHQLEQKLADSHTKFYGNSLTVVLYDVTTLYFESARDGDEYKVPGYSKDGKHKDPQILVGLLTNTEGFPLAYETFAGNTFEGHTLLTALQNWQQTFGQSKIRVIADAGMLSKLNVASLVEHGFDFIVGARLRSMNDTMTKKLTVMEKEDMAVKTFAYSGHSLIIQYSEKRAKKDRHTIDKATTKAQAIIDGKQSLKRRSKFVVIDEPSKTAISLNQTAIDQDKALAGLKGYITNLKNVAEEEIIAQYHELWHVEKSFRMSKSDLRARPIFHYKEDSIKAHLLIVVMALAVAKLLEKDSGQSIQRTVEQLGQALSFTLEDEATGITRVQHPKIELLNLPEKILDFLSDI